MIQNLKLDNIFTTSKKRKDEIAEILKTTQKRLRCSRKLIKQSKTPIMMKITYSP